MRVASSDLPVDVVIVVVVVHHVGLARHGTHVVVGRDLAVTDVASAAGAEDGCRLGGLSLSLGLGSLGSLGVELARVGLPLLGLAKDGAERGGIGVGAGGGTEAAGAVQLGGSVGDSIVGGTRSLAARGGVAAGSGGRLGALGGGVHVLLAPVLVVVVVFRLVVLGRNVLGGCGAGTLDGCGTAGGGLGRSSPDARCLGGGTAGRLGIGADRAG